MNTKRRRSLMNAKHRLSIAIIHLMVIVLLIFSLQACTLPQTGQPPQQLPEEPAKQKEMIPEIALGQMYYRIPLPYQVGSGKPSYDKSIFPARIDTTRLELGMMEIAQKTFPVDRFAMQEGQLLSQDDIRDWLATYDTNKNTLGLNDPDYTKPPLIYLMERDFLAVDTGELAGVGITLAFRPNPQIVLKDAQGAPVLDEEGRKKTETKNLTDEELIALARSAGDKINQRLVERGVHVPVLFAGFVSEPNSTLLPGRFFVKGVDTSGDGHGIKWEDFNERYILFPGNKAKTDNEKRMEATFTSFSQGVETFFSQYTGVIGLVRLVNDTPIEWTFTITADYRSKTQILALLETIAELDRSILSQSMDVSVYVQSIDRLQGLYVRGAGQEPFYHLYRNQ